ncbi:MAG: uracil-DNA glycosylase [Puniceicoccales bacterium]|nr:uracil-DNA glycosylase [Puniceicoccales bacterium]
MELQSLASEGVCHLPIALDSLRSLVKVPNESRALAIVGSTPRTVTPPPPAGAENWQSTLESGKICEKIALPAGGKLEKYEWLKNKVLHCEVCQKHVRPGKKIVFGVGNVDADIFFCGEAPGADEETIGEPFVGRAGQLLTKIITAMGLSRDDVYIANIMNWRPETPMEIGNRPPTREEMEFCLPYLLAQIEIVRPSAIVALGSTAANGLLGHDPSRRMYDIRGRWMSFASTPLMVTFHPSYLLRNNTNAAKRTVWLDMLAVMERLSMHIDERQRGYFL